MKERRVRAGRVTVPTPSSPRALASVARRDGAPGMAELRGKSRRSVMIQESKCAGSETLASCALNNSTGSVLDKFAIRCKARLAAMGENMTRVANSTRKRTPGWQCIAKRCFESELMSQAGRCPLRRPHPRIRRAFRPVMLILARAREWLQLSRGLAAPSRHSPWRRTYRSLRHRRTPAGPPPRAAAPDALTAALRAAAWL